MYIIVSIVERFVVNKYFKINIFVRKHDFDSEKFE